MGSNPTPGTDGRSPTGRAATADTGYVMLVEALFTWFALSIPATLIIGRMIGAASSDDSVPSWSHEARCTRTVCP